MKVKIYTTNWCTWCRKAKEFFRLHNIEFEERNVEWDHEAAHEMIEKTQQNGVPVIEIDGKTIIGYDIEALEKALGLNRRIGAEAI